VHGSRFSGRTAYNFLGRLRFARRIIVGHSTRLLYVAPVLGALMALTGLVMTAVIVAARLADPATPAPGWASVMTAVFFAGGITNIMLGLIGLYLAELFDWSKGRPRYVVSQTTGTVAAEPAETAPGLDEMPEAAMAESAMAAASLRQEQPGTAGGPARSASGW
jgi:dolichol-phosphate mannosyltransferase